MAQTIVITGAGRGIGLALARRWHERGDTVIAVGRSRPAALDALGARVIEHIDVGRDADMPRLQAALGDTTIDVLFHNAGVMHDESLQHMGIDGIREQFEVNALGPLRVTTALLDRMGNGARIGLLTSRMGSIADNDSGGRYGYRMSKAALNAAGKSLALDLHARGIAVAILHPGFVRTDMTGHNGHIDPDRAAEQLVARMDALDLASSGTFRHADGSVLPW